MPVPMPLRKPVLPEPSPQTVPRPDAVYRLYSSMLVPSVSKRCANVPPPVPSLTVYAVPFEQRTETSALPSSATDAS